MNEENIQKDVLEIARLMRSYAEDCGLPLCCSDCSFGFFCESGYPPDKFCNVIEALIKNKENT